MNDRSNSGLAGGTILVRGGELVDAGARHRGDLLIRDGRIVEAAPAVAAPAGAQIIDAAGLWVLPGGVDPHVHLSAPPGAAPAWVDDFESGSRAAFAGGVTTVGNMAFPAAGESLAELLEREGAAAGRGGLDVVLHPVVTAPTEGLLRSLPQAADAGLRTLKLFTSLTSFASCDPAWQRLFRAAAELDLLVLAHCEDRGILQSAARRQLAAGRTTFRHFPAFRPVAAEVEAVRDVLALAERTGARLYVVHLSSAEALSLCRDARDRGVAVAVEARPLYLHLTDAIYAHPDAALFAATPPPRAAADRDALWEALAGGGIDTVGSDHAAWRRADKLTPGHTPDRPRAGVPNLQEMLPMLFAAGVAAARLPPERFVELTATAPACLLGLHPRKGTLAPGADADVALWDPTRPWRLSSEGALSRAAHTVYEGTTGIGAPVLVLRRGRRVYFAGGSPGWSERGIVLRPATG